MCTKHVISFRNTVRRDVYQKQPKPRLPRCNWGIRQANQPLTHTRLDFLAFSS